jgi:ribosomal protein S18 acetylase RimI-like enzyme
MNTHMNTRIIDTANPLTSAELAALSRLIKESWRRVYQEVGSYTKAYETDESIWGEATLRAELDRGNRWLLGEEEEEGILVAAVVLDSIEHHGEPALQLRTLGVWPERRGQGLAPQMIDAVAELARQEGRAYITLYTSGLLEGLVRFYKSIGFHEYKREHVERFGKQYDRVFFERAL